MSDKLLSLKWKNHQSTFFHVLSGLQEKNLYSDVTLACDGELFAAHKFVLSSCSDYFASILEVTQCKCPVIILKDVNKVHLLSLLRYMYHGEAEVNQADLSSLIKVAETLQIKGLAVPDNIKSPQLSDSPSQYSDYTSSTPRKRPKGIGDKKYEPKEKMPRTEREPPDNDNRVDNFSESNSVHNDKSLKKVDDHSSRTIVPPIKLEDDVDHLNNIKSENIDDEIYECTPEEQEIFDTFSKQEAGPSGMMDDASKWLENSVGFNDMAYNPHQQSEDNTTNDQEHLLKSIGESVENGVKYYHCPICPYKTFRRWHLTKHIRRHCGETRFSCQWCGYRTFDKYNLNVHLKVHTGEKPFRCEFCDFSAITKSHLKYHLTKNHEDQQETSQEVEENDTDLN